MLHPPFFYPLSTPTFHRPATEKLYTNDLIFFFYTLSVSTVLHKSFDLSLSCIFDEKNGAQTVRIRHILVPQLYLFVL